MKRILLILPLLLLVLPSAVFVPPAVPVFVSVVPNATNASAVVTFSPGVYSDAGTTMALTTSSLVVSVTASTGGGSVVANANVPYTITHTAGATTATLNFTGTPFTGADGTETLTVVPTNGTSVYDATGPMLGTATISANLKDLFAPVAFTTGAVTATAGTVVGGYWNSTNTGVSVTVPIANDGSLVGGKIQLEAMIAPNPFAAVGGLYTIAAMDKTNGFATVTLNTGQVTGIAGYAQMKAIAFNAIITDTNSNSTTGTASSSTLTVDTVVPTVTVNQDPGPPTVQADPAFALPVKFRAVFSEAIDPTTFTIADVPPGGTATGKTASNVAQFNPPNDGTTWEIDVTATGSGTVTESLAATKVTDLAGNPNNASTSTDNSVQFYIGPTANPSNITFSSVTTISIKVNLGTGGNASNYLLVAEQGIAGSASFVPQPGTGYTANANYSAATELGGGRVVGSGAGPFTVTGLVPGTAYDFVVYGFDGSGTSANYLIAGAPTGNQSTTACAVIGSSSAVSLTASATHISATWTRSSTSDNTLIIMKQGATASTTVPANGTDYSSLANRDLSVPPGTIAAGEYVMFAGTAGAGTGQTLTSTSNNFKNLLQSTQYSFTFWEYDPTTLCYTATKATGSATTTGPLAEASLSSGTSPATYTYSIASPGTQVFQFTIADAGVDNVDTQISALTINQDNPNNTITDWSQVIMGAQLSDGTHTATVTSIGVSSIQFPTITPTTLGTVSDGTSKVYTLTVWFINPLSAGLKSTIDGLAFSFKLSNTDITTVAGGSTMAVSSTSSNQACAINIVASQLTFTKQPPATATATLPFGVANQPILTAIDAYGNYDRKPITATVTTTPVDLGPNSAPTGFTNGTMDFSTANTFNYQNASGTPAKMTVTTTSPALTVTSTQATTVTSTITLGASAFGMAASPLINSSSSNYVLGFSLKTDGGTFNMTGLTFTTVSSPTNQAPNNYIATYHLYSGGTDNGGTVTGATGVGSVANQVTFTGLSIPVNSTVAYYYVVVDVDPNFPTYHPTLQFNIATSGLTVSGGSAFAGGPISGSTYQFNDNTPPTLTVGINQGTINSVILNEVVTLTYSEPMDQTTTPTISLSPGNSNFTTTSPGWADATHYHLTFVHNATQEEGFTETAVVVSPSGAQDIGKNNDTGGGTSASFIVDTKLPTVASMTATTTYSSNTILNQVNNVLTIKVVFSETMNTGVPPVIAFNHGTLSVTAPAAGWTTTNVLNDTYTITYIDNTTTETFPSVTVTANSAHDANGNTQTAAGPAMFSIDTQRPTVTSIVAASPSNANPINNAATPVTYTVTFSESVVNVDAGDFVVTTSGTTGSVTNVTGSGTTWTVTVGGITGDGTIRLDVPATATINDLNGNAYNVLFNSGQLYTIDNTPPLLGTLLPVNNALAVPDAPTLSISLTDANTKIAQAAVAGTHFIKIYQTTGSVLVGTIDAHSTTGLTLTPGGAPTTLNINLATAGVTLLPSTSYYITIDAGALTDIAGNAFAGFSSTTAWTFQTYDLPTITSIAGTGSGGAACIGTTLTVNGKNFKGYPNIAGIASITFYAASNTSNNVVVSSGITVVSDTQLTLTMPNGALSGINDQIKVKLTSNSQTIPGLGTNTGGISSSFSNTIDLGATTVAFSTPIGVSNNGAKANLCDSNLDKNGVAITGASDPTQFTFSLVVSGGSSPSHPFTYSVDAATGSATYSGSPLPLSSPANPVTAVNGTDHIYNLTSVTDNFGCVVPNHTSSMTVTVFTRPVPVITPALQPIVLAAGNSSMAVAGTINGSLTSGSWSSIEGIGSFTSSPFAATGISNSPSSTYTFALVDFTRPSLTFVLTADDGTGNNVCKGAKFSQVVPIASTPLGNNICSTSAVDAISGFVTGGVSTATLTVTSRTPKAPSGALEGYFSSNPIDTVTTNVSVTSNSFANSYTWSAWEIANNVALNIQLSWNNGGIKTDNLLLSRQPSITLTSPATSASFSQKQAPAVLSFSYAPAVISLDSVTVTGSGILFNTAKSPNDYWTFNPSALSAGNYKINYSYTNNACVATGSADWIVFAGNLNYYSGGIGTVPDSICVNSGRFRVTIDPLSEEAANVTGITVTNLVTGLPDPNVNFDPALKTATIDPSFAGTNGGQLRVDYTAIDPLTPLVTQSFTAKILTINPRPTLAPPILSRDYCTNDNAIALIKGSQNPLSTYFFYVKDDPLGTNTGVPGKIINPTNIVTYNAGNSTYYLVPKAGSSLFNSSDINDFLAKAVEIAYVYTDANSCADTTNNVNLVQFHRQPPPPVIAGGINPALTVCVSSHSSTSPVYLTTGSSGTYANNGSNPTNTSVYWSTDPTFPASSTASNGTNSNFIPTTLANNAATKYYVRQTHFDGGNFPATASLSFSCPSDSAVFFYEKTNVAALPFTSTGFTIGPLAYSVDLTPINVSITPNTLNWQILDVNNTLVSGTNQTNPAVPLAINNQNYNLPVAGFYAIQSVLTSSRTCTDTLRNDVLIVGSVTVTDNSSAYQENFGVPGDAGQWISKPNSGWVLEVPNKPTIKAPADTVWVTSVPGAPPDSTGYPQNSIFYIYSPLLNLQLTRPMVSLDTWSDSPLDNDGAVLEYSVDGKGPLDPTKSWVSVGFSGGGANWYNSTNLQSAPGSGKYVDAQNQPKNGFQGWSGPETAFVKSNFILDNVIAAGNPVIFRMGFGSIGSATGKDGFAFDNFRIGNRTRTVLLENFTNSGDTGTEEKISNDSISSFVSRSVGTQIVLINYHVEFPGIDPFNLDNSYDPSARALYYNISTTPRSRLDGDNGGATYVNRPFPAWGIKEYGVRTLQLGQAGIDLSSSSVQADSIAIVVKISPTVNLDKNTIIHAVVVEDTVALTSLSTANQTLISNGSKETGFNYVLKKMLPAASGMKTGPLSSTSTYNFKFGWTPDPRALYPLSGSTDNLSVIVFLQNDSTKEVYQTEFKKLAYNVPAVITGLEPIPDNEVKIFPNPADQQFTIEIPGVASTDLNIRLVDPVGRMIPSGKIEAGSNKATVSTRELSGGIYILQLGSGNSLVTRKKVLILHDK
jgi:Secretion system C-terminal sorting domain